MSKEVDDIIKGTIRAFDIKCWDGDVEYIIRQCIEAVLEQLAREMTCPSK